MDSPAIRPSNPLEAAGRCCHFRHDGPPGGRRLGGDRRIGRRRGRGGARPRAGTRSRGSEVTPERHAAVGHRSDGRRARVARPVRLTPPPRVAYDRAADRPDAPASPHPERRRTAMLDLHDFSRDCQDLLERKLRRGEIDRRRFLALGAALGLAAVAPGRAAAQGKQVVLVNWGGIANDAFSRFYGKPFEERNSGVKVVMDSSGPSAGKIRTMAESRKVTWDLCDSSASSSILLGAQGLLEPIDYGVVDRANLLPRGFAYPHGVAPYSFSSVLLYDAGKFGADPPKSWADFLDFQKYPGKRMLRRDATAVLDAL